MKGERMRLRAGVMILLAVLTIQPLVVAKNEVVDIVDISQEPELWDMEYPYQPPIEYLLLEKLVMAEAGGECFEGQCMVARVIMNRVESDMFPDGLMEVLTQFGQFEPVTDGSVHSMVPSESVKVAVQSVMEGWGDDNPDARAALYFDAAWHASDTWAGRNREFLCRIGNQNFYK